MDDEVAPVNRWLPKLAVVVAVLSGGALVALWATTEDAPGWWLVVGIALLVVFLPILAVGIRFWTMDPEERAARLATTRARSAQLHGTLDRSTLAHRATKHNKDVLATGTPAEALVTFLADGGRANEHRSLVYLELEVHAAGAEPWPVRTGEYVTAASSGTLEPGAVLQVKVDPADPQRVAVDWDETLRLR